MDNLFRKGQVFTLPNLLSLLRLLMIPLIVMLYRSGKFAAAAGMVVISGLTDVADGIIAREFGLVSDLGKILDPVADKLTQAALIFCLISRYDRMRWLLVLFAVKEIVMVISGIAVIRKKDMVNSAQWFGKLATFVIYAVMFLLFLFPGIPERAADGMILGCIAVILLSWTKYLAFYRRLLRPKNKNG